MATARSFDFNVLPAATRQRLVYALTSRDAGYAPLLSDVPGLAGRLVGRGFLVLLGLGTLAVAALVERSAFFRPGSEAFTRAAAGGQR